MAFSMLLCLSLFISLCISIFNYFTVLENNKFYSNTPTVTYDELNKDLTQKKIITYSTNIVYPSYLEFSDIVLEPKNLSNIYVYRFYYADGSFKHYEIDKLKTDSLTTKEGKDNSALYNLKNKKGENISLVAFGISDLISLLLTIGIILFVLIGVQFMIGEVVAGKNFAAKTIDTDIKFDDIIGYDDVKEQFKEIAAFIKNKQHFENNELTVPRGILLTGEPGVGKTMFAKAFANEVNASLFFASGSDFAELYVGVGAKRIRNLFRTARISAPSIIFIDEFDAIGSREGMFKDSERTSVINQLLTEMDGLGIKRDVFVIATTNYENKIDSALLRPGRIDRKINVPSPDKHTRKAIIKKYLGNFIASEETLDSLSIKTQGYSGATLKNLVDETKSFVVKKNGIGNKTITLEDFNLSQENMLLGLKKSLDFNKEQEKRIAYHELGHAIASLILNPHHTVEKITIEPRGNALGFTMITPTEEQFLYTKEELLNQVCVLLAGRAAEDIFLGSITNGARDDLNRANKIVNDMIESFGMGDEHPLLVNISNGNDSNEFNKKERARILSEQYSIVRNLIVSHKEALNELAQELITEKRITGETMLNKLKIKSS